MFETWGIYVFFGAILLAIFLYPKIRKVLRQDTEDEDRIRKSLSDDYLYDPKTGAKFTVEQAVSGQWLSHDNLDRLKSDEEISEFYSSEEQILERLANELKKSGFQYSESSDEEIEILGNTHTLANYDTWFVKSRYISPDASYVVNFIRVVANPHFKQAGFQGFQMLFETKIPDFDGHYLITERTFAEPLLELFVGKDDFAIKGLDVRTIRKGWNPMVLQEMLADFANESNLEIEINGENFYLKTFSEPNFDDFLRLEPKIQRLAQS
ncbi:hypothetical protein [Flavobacterium sp.]|uniref:hypothetical protein n=1 Tax=Flavobacterium sp. TaxID=239 RepID=UPI0011FFD002|nr:hypothetical protein [Flavobacterium sp.]RZJ69037.1 MAG: hypothetical protein EOO49_18755 [Flavobacterium sp.]